MGTSKIFFVFLVFAKLVSSARILEKDINEEVENIRQELKNVNSSFWVEELLRKTAIARIEKANEIAKQGALKEEKDLHLKIGGITFIRDVTENLTKDFLVKCVGTRLRTGPAVSKALTELLSKNCSYPQDRMVHLATKILKLLDERSMTIHAFIEEVITAQEESTCFVHAYKKHCVQEFDGEVCGGLVHKNPKISEDVKYIFQKLRLYEK